MIDEAQIRPLLDGGTVETTDGENIGKIGQVFVDDQTGHPSWVTVKTGFFGMNESFVPLADATLSGDVVKVPYDKAKGGSRAARTAQDDAHKAAMNRCLDANGYRVAAWDAASR